MDLVPRVKENIFSKNISKKPNIPPGPKIFTVCCTGFGVCCVLTVGSGTTSSTNNTYLVQSSTTSAGSHTYTICPTNTDVCKLRIDFEKFVTTATSSGTGVVGNCADDVLVISNPTGPNPPILCGTLTGQVCSQ